MNNIKNEEKKIVYEFIYPVGNCIACENEIINNLFGHSENCVSI